MQILRTCRAGLFLLAFYALASFTAHLAEGGGPAVWLAAVMDVPLRFLVILAGTLAPGTAPVVARFLPVAGALFYFALGCALGRLFDRETRRRFGLLPLPWRAAALCAGVYAVLAVYALVYSVLFFPRHLLGFHILSVINAPLAPLLRVLIAAGVNPALGSATLVAAGTVFYGALGAAAGWLYGRLRRLYTR